ncbi:homoserine kinase [Melioribacter roseus P3M-2]|uniref:Homoserine kinase n=1 Tax=Melioribacter roseus (strain DSM 23840 / JCM 17771 / VKM B-2668 / P3M-2) TaxID=1191523 RepID=I6ZZE7_MELRP|nr:homoserine kinase [Melioribacter roseus]AFN74373.1 homoserine kinase [Melioribacter roseus P3M-2]
MSSKSIKVFAPASVSNVGPGFDMMGFALHTPGDEVTVKLTDRKEIRIVKISGDNGYLPYEIEKNTTTGAMLSLLKKYRINAGMDVFIHKKMGIGSGLGSSAASAVAGVFALNELLELRLSRYELLEHALKGEFIASRSIHADNVAPCLYGGFVLIRSYNPIDIIKIDYPDDLYCSIVYPNIEIKTSEARKLISKNVSMKKAIAQAGNASALIAGLITADYDLIGRSIVDYFAEPKRAALIPCYDDVRNAALEKGAINCNITGSGPSMFAFSRTESDARSIARAMLKAVKSAGFDGKTYVSKINKKGPVVLK